MTAPRLALAAALFAAAHAHSPAHAGWPNDPGVNVPIAPSVSQQWMIYPADDGAGGLFVIWGENNDIRAQHLTAQGLVAPGWPAGGRVICGAPGAQYPTAITPDGAGGFIAVWDDYRADPAADVWAQRIAADGSPVWAVDGVPVVLAANTQATGRVVSDRAGGAIVVWWDFRDVGTNSYDIYAQRISATGAPMWGASGTPVCVMPGDQSEMLVVGDGTVGGAYFVWTDSRSGLTDLYAQRLDQYGAPRPGWAPNGSVLCNAAGNQSLPAMVSDGAFGALVTWVDERTDYDIYGMRMTPGGPSAPGWTANGVALVSDFFFQYYPTVVSDGAGGGIFAWQDYRFGHADIYAQRIGAAGAVAWAPGGVPLIGLPGNQYFPKAVSDGAGGAMVGWLDERAGFPPMIFAQHVTGTGAIGAGFAADGNAVATATWPQELSAVTDGAGGAVFVWQHNDLVGNARAQRIDRWGYLGAQARIASVADVPNDQGGRVKVSWDRSPIDAYPGNEIATYRVYRSVPPQSAEAALAAGLAELESSDAAGARRAAAAGRVLTATAFAGATYYWEEVAAIAARQLPGYSHVAVTEQDSVADSNPMTLFMVRAEDAFGTRFWLSDPDSGYSTDDLAPLAPAPFAGAYGSGATHLHWGANAEADFAFYRLYRGASAGFVPGPGNLIATQPDTGYADAGPAGSFYKLTAVDAHGNESPASLVSPSNTVEVPAMGAPRVLAFAPPAPNPSVGAVTFRFSLPADGRVRLSLHDVAGREVRVLMDARLDAGDHITTWDGRLARGGRAPSGIYFGRIEFEGRLLTRRLLRLE